MNIKILYPVILLIILSAVYPIYFHYQDKSVPEMPPHHSYEQALGHMLPDSVRSKAAAANCSGVILPLTDIEGADNSFPHLREDINLALTAYAGWQVKADARVRRQMRQRLEANIKKWGAMYSGSEMMRIARTQKAVDSDTRTSVSAKWFYQDGTKGDNVKLLVTVYDELRQGRRFQIALTLMHPQKKAGIEKHIAARKAQLQHMQRNAALSMNLFYGFSGLLVLLILGQVTAVVINRGREKHMKKFLLAEIGKREELVENGHFVTAHELAEKYLKYFPDDTDIRAFHQRLLDFTNNDPKTAQTAFVEARKLKSRLSQHASEPKKLLLSGNEKDSLKALLPYHPELNATYNQLLEIEEQTRSRAHFEAQVNDFKNAMRGGYPGKAGHILEQMESMEDADCETAPYRREWQQMQQSAKDAFNRVTHLFRSGDIRSGSSELNNLLDDYKDYEPALQLKEELTQSAAAETIRLCWENHHLNLELYLKDELIIGRSDEGMMPDVAFDDRRISRNHARLRRTDGKAEISDQGSTGGTYIDGKKITTATLNDRNVLNLSKIIEFNILLTGDAAGRAEGILMQHKTRNVAQVFERLVFGISNGHFDSRGTSYTIYRNETAALLTWENGFSVIYPGKYTHAGEDRIKMEAIAT